MSQTSQLYTNVCYFIQEKHIRRPYLAFDDVLGDALQVLHLLLECITKFSSIMFERVLKEKGGLLDLVKCQ